MAYSDINTVETCHVKYKIRYYTICHLNYPYILPQIEREECSFNYLLNIIEDHKEKEWYSLFIDYNQWKQAVDAWKSE